MAQKTFNFPFVDNYNEISGPFVSFRPTCNCEGSTDSGNAGSTDGMSEDEVQKLISELLANKELELVNNDGEYELTVGGEVKGVITIPEDRHISNVELIDGQLVVSVEGMDAPLTADFSQFATSADIDKAVEGIKNGASESFDTLKEIEDAIVELQSDVQNRPTEEVVDSKIQEAVDDIEIPETPDLSVYATKDDYSSNLGEIYMLKQILKSVLAGENNHVTTADNVTKENGNLLVSGDVDGDMNTATVYEAKDGNVSLYEMELNNAPMDLRATKGDLTISEVTASGSAGSGYGTDTVVKKNCFTAYVDGNLTVKNVILDLECYNGFLINNNGTSLSDSVTFENVAIGNTNNNAILILATKDYAVINIKNVAMRSVKNAIRLSNFKHAKGVVVNLENVDVSEAREKFILLEDYITRTSSNGLADDNSDLFKDIVINMKNCKCNGELITAETPISDFVQMVVGKPSLGSDNPVSYEEHPESFPTFVF